MRSNLDLQARPRQAWNSLEAEWPPGKRERLADRFSILGRIGFYLQLALLACHARGGTGGSWHDAVAIVQHDLVAAND